MYRKTLFVAMATGALLLAGCYSSGVDRNWGRAHRVNTTAQTKHPDAPQSLEQSGLDGVTAQQAMANHRERTVDKVSQTPAASVINIGTGIGEQ